MASLSSHLNSPELPIMCSFLCKIYAFLQSTYLSYCQDKSNEEEGLLACEIK